MEQILVFVEKLVGVITSQRFVVTVAGLIVLGLTLFNVVMPLFQPDFGGVDVPAQEALAAQIMAWLMQFGSAAIFIVGVIRSIAQLTGSFEQQPPSLNRASWDQRKAMR